jgi:hypothetical protein
MGNKLDWDKSGTNPKLLNFNIRSNLLILLVLVELLKHKRNCLEGISQRIKLKFVSVGFGLVSLWRMALFSRSKSPDKSGSFREKTYSSGTNLGQRYRALASPNQLNGKTIGNDESTWLDITTPADLEKKNFKKIMGPQLAGGFHV